MDQAAGESWATFGSFFFETGRRDTVDSAALQVALVAVLSPILLAAGVLHLLSTAHLGASAAAFNVLAVALGGMRFAWHPAGRTGGMLTVGFALTLILALAANTRLCVRFWKARPEIPPPDGVPASAPRRTAPVTSRVPPPPSARKDDSKGVKILSPTAWVLHNMWGDVRVYTIPQAIADQNRSLPGSDRKLRIVFDDEDDDPIEGVFTISPALQILLPPEHLERLKEKELVRFEIVG